MTESKIKKPALAKPSPYFEFIKQLDIDQVRLHDSEVRDLRPVSKVGGTYEIQISRKAKHETCEGGFRVLETFILDGIDAKSKEKALMLSVTFLVVYSSKVTLDDKMFDQFEKTNLTVHTWPYFREYVQNSFSRMGIPMVVAPVFKHGIANKSK
jgi:hypothetical protein